MAATTLPLISTPYPAADMIYLDNQIIQSINANLTNFTNANPVVGVSNVGNTLGITSVQGANQVIFAGGNNITVSQSVATNNLSATITISANNEASIGVSNLGNTAGSTGLGNAQYVFVGGNNITLSQSTAASGATLSINGFNDVSHVIYPDAQLSAISAAVNGSQSIQYLPLKDGLSMTQAGILGSLSVGTGANLSSVLLSISQWMAIYTNNAGTLSSVLSGSGTASTSFTSNGTSSVNGNVQFTVPMSGTLAPGDYYVLCNLSTQGYNSSAGGTTTSGNATITMYGGVQIGSANNFVTLGGGTASTLGLYTGMGMHTSTSNAVPATIPLGSVNNTGTNIQIANLGVQFRAV